MALIKIKGNTYYIQGATNIGVFAFKNKNCMLIDSGINNSVAKRIDNILIENNLHIKYIINTHSHMDHCGGNLFFKKEYPGSIIYASHKEKLYMENPELFSNMLFSVPNSFKELDRLPRPIDVDFTLDYGINKINEEKFEVLSIEGHSSGHIGVITPEKVCFLGDSIFSEGILEKYKLPYLINIDEEIRTLNKIKEIEADYFLISHIDRVLNKEEIIELANINITIINKFEKEIIDILDQPQTRESLLENILVLNDIKTDFSMINLNFATISAYLSNLNARGIIEYSINDGKVYYYIK